MTRVIPAVLALVTMPLWLNAQAPQFRATADVVAVDVSVRDRSRVVTTLGAADFALTDNDVPQKIVSVSYGKLPIDVTVALDISASVDGPRLQQLRRGVSRLVEELGPDDRLRLLTFNMRVSRLMDFTNDVSVVDRAMQQLSAGGGTAIWDTAVVALSSSAPIDRRQLLVLFTDGSDGSSITAPVDLMNLAYRMNTTIASVVPAGAVFRPTKGSGAAVLEALAADTGGSAMALQSVRDDLGSTFTRVLDQFRSTYVLHFQPDGVSASGFHTLTVTIPGRSGLTIRARRGYFR